MVRCLFRRFIFCPKICLRPGVPRFGGGPGSINRGMFYAPVWREHKMLGPLHLWTNFWLFELFNLTNQVCTAAEKRCVNVYIYTRIVKTSQVAQVANPGMTKSNKPGQGRG